MGKIRRISYLGLALALALIFPPAVPRPVSAASTAGVIINGQVLQTDPPPVIENGRLLVPFRAILEALGAKVEYDPATRLVRSRRDLDVVEIWVDSRTGHVNGKPVTLDVPARVVKGRTMVPVRFVSEALGFDVRWEGAARTAFIQAAPKAGLGPADSPWPMSWGDAGGSGRSSLPGPRKGAVLWRFVPEGDQIVSPPVIGADGTVYFTGQMGNVYAVTPAGKAMWQASIGGMAQGGLVALSDNSVVVTAVGMTGGVFRLHKGEVIERLFSDGGSESHPVALPGSILVGTLGGQVFALESRNLEIFSKGTVPTNAMSVVQGRKGNIYVLSGARVLSALRLDEASKSGSKGYMETLWQFDLATIGAGRLAVGRIPLEEREQIYFTDDGRLYALDEEGHLAWVTPPEMGRGFGPLAVGPDGTVYAGSGALYAFSPAGELSWSVPGNTAHVVVDAEGTIYVVFSADADHGPRLAALDSRGWTLWETELPFAPAFFNGLAIGFNRTLYLTTLDSGLIAIDEAVPKEH